MALASVLKQKQGSTRFPSAAEYTFPKTGRPLFQDRILATDSVTLAKPEYFRWKKAFTAAFVKVLARTFGIKYNKKRQ
ncbi:hypothetical protein O4H49_06205 [Kiloniella laminariae]|uniref:Uncharacterized protein n=1 Tax=Kiloniella laminariae TaxID=454162 RepID=A0ABT4LGY3_9PROT|nr:hypothetical protein [Kiloniella laminariae]MCZ4280360.1 hypothetical protein [Kiloniella laminariae]